MARIKALNILLEDQGKAYLSELYGKVIQNVQKRALSSLFKNVDLSGDPVSGTVEANRYQNSKSNEYGTARRQAKGDAVVARPVTVPVNIDREIIEEIEKKDILLNGVDGLLDRRSKNHIDSMVKELDRAFFLETALGAENNYEEDQAKSVAENIEAQIVSLEKTQNEFVDGVTRNLMALVLDTQTYSLIRNYLDTSVGNANVSTAAEGFGYFHGVEVHSTVYLPAGVKGLLFVIGSTAQPVISTEYEANRIGLSQAYAVELYYDYGTKVVTPDLINAWKRQLAKPTVSLATGTLTITNVDNAKQYEIYAGLAKVATVDRASGASTTVALANHIDTAGTYSVTVVAINNKDAYKQSVKSEAVSYTKS